MLTLCVFLAISVGGIESGYNRIHGVFDDAARNLGQNNFALLWRVHLPLLRPAIISAALLIFVDCMKELPATLLLRPLNMETLATQLYAEASRGTYEDGAVAALLIVLVGSDSCYSYWQSLEKPHVNPPHLLLNMPEQQWVLEQK